MSGRADARAKAARAAARDRMLRAAARLRAGDEPGDVAGAREAAARLLARLAEQDLDIHTFGDAAYLADRVLTTPPHLMTDGAPLPSGYNNGTDRVR